MIELILTSLYFFLPAYIANMAPVLFRRIPFLDQPVWEEKLGKNKTWRGIVVATVMGGIVFYIQQLAYSQGFTKWALIDYNDYSVGLGFLLGLGAIAGDVVKSYYKRKAGIKPGERWFPFDQVDFVLGGMVLSWLVYVPPAGVVLVLLVASPVLHIIVNHIGYYLKINSAKW